MQFQTIPFLAWQEAERRACDAERSLFARVLARDSNDIPSPEEVAEVRALREASSARMQEMLDEMRKLAAALRYEPLQPAAQAEMRPVHARGRAGQPAGR